tara:strand:- start:109 stop:1722 length:1614 start_codon:yes stop_codon:yes gene_type:complete
MRLYRNIFLFSLFLFISLGLYCASNNGWLPLVHGPYYFSIAQSLFHYNEINQYAIYPPVQPLVYTLQIGISFFEYLIFFISEKYWYLLFYAIISLIWVVVFTEFLKLNIKILTKIDKYLIFTIFFLQPYNLNQLGNFSNEALYFPLLLYFYFSFFRFSSGEKANKYYWIIFGSFVIIGVYFRLQHVVLCASIFIFSLFLKNKKIPVYLIFLGILKLIIFFLIINYTYLNNVFLDHYLYLDKNIVSYENHLTFESLIRNFERFSIIITYPLLLTKFTSNVYVYYFFGLIILFLMFKGFKILKKENNFFNFYMILYFLLSTIFILLLPPFEYSYILPFSFIIFIYSFIGFKKIIPKFYKTVLKLSFAFAGLTIIVSYFFVGSSLIEGHTYRDFVQDLRKNYVLELQDEGIFYIAKDAYDHFEDFYWQNKKKRPFCQLIKVKVEKCMQIQEKNNDNFILIVGKDIERLGVEYGYKDKWEEFDRDKDTEPFIEILTKSFNVNEGQHIAPLYSDEYVLDRYYRSEFFYSMLFRRSSLRYKVK